jgi:hypothetical protein
VNSANLGWMSEQWLAEHRVECATLVLMPPTTVSVVAARRIVREPDGHRSSYRSCLG